MPSCCIGRSVKFEEKNCDSTGCGSAEPTKRNFNCEKSFAAIRVVDILFERLSRVVLSFVIIKFNIDLRSL